MATSENEIAAREEAIIVIYYDDFGRLRKRGSAREKLGAVKRVPGLFAIYFPSQTV